MYRSDIFTIKYEKEEVYKISKQCIFQHHVYLPTLDEAKFENTRLPLMLEAKLYHCSSPDDYQHQDMKYEFMEISRCVYRLGDVFTGIYKVVPVEFTHPFSSVLYLSAHCCLSRMIPRTPYEEMSGMFNQSENSEAPRTSRRKSEVNAGSMSLLFPYDWRSKKKVISYDQAKEVLKMRCKVFIWQFNKLRDSYKELYKHLKSSGEAESLVEVKLIEHRLELDYGVLMDFEDESAKRVFESEMNADADEIFGGDDGGRRESLPKTRVTKSQADYTKFSVTDNSVFSPTKRGLTDIGSEPVILFVKGTQVLGGATKREKMSPSFATGRIEKEYKNITDLLSHVWKRYLRLLNINHIKVLEFLYSKYEVHYKRMIKKRKITRKVDWLTSKLTSGTFKREISKSQTLRDIIHDFMSEETARGLCYPLKFYECQNQPVFIEEICEPDVKNHRLFEVPDVMDDEESASWHSDDSKSSDIRKHCVFMCHGYNGEPGDLKYLQNVINFKDPEAYVHSCTRFAKNRTKSLERLGELVADEIIDHIEMILEEHPIEKITLIGYSMGGLILRSALPHIGVYKKYLHTFMTLCTPHIGYLTTHSKLLTAGMWVAGTFNINNSIAEITISDKKDMRECALYLLAQKEGLDWFKSVILIGSSQDGYSPVESSLVQMSHRVEKVKFGQELKEMAEFLLKRLINVRVHRIRVNFKIRDSNFDTFVGRKAHIEFIDNSELIKMLFLMFEDTF